MHAARCLPYLRSDYKVNAEGHALKLLSTL